MPTCSREWVTVGLATIPARKEFAKKAVHSLLGQIDKMVVCLNGYSEVPDFLWDPRIETVIDELNSKADNAKFVGADSASGYFLAIDDDIVFPEDYVDKMIEAVERYGRKAIVGIHGIIYKQPFEDYLRDRIVCSYRSGLEADRQVHALGTGAIAFHRRYVQVSIEVFPDVVHAADILLADWAKRNGVPMIAIKRPEGWLKTLDDGNIESIWRKTLTDITFREKVFNLVKSVEPW